MSAVRPRVTVGVRLDAGCSLRVIAAAAVAPVTAAAECMAAAAAAAAAAEVTKFNVIQLRAPGCKLVSAYTVYPVTPATHPSHRFSVRMGLETLADDATAAMKSASVEEYRANRAPKARELQRDRAPKARSLK